MRMIIQSKNFNLKRKYLIGKHISKETPDTPIKK